MVREAVREALEELRQEASQKAMDEIALAERALAKFNSLIEGVAELDLPTDNGIRYKHQAEKVLNEAAHLKAQETYFELLDAQAKACEVQQICERGIAALSIEAHSALDSRQSELESQLQSLTQDFENAQRKIDSQAQQQLKNIEDTLDKKFSPLWRKIENERYELVKKIEEEREEWEKKAREAWTDEGVKTIGCLIGCLSGLAGCAICDVNLYKFYKYYANEVYMYSMLSGAVIWVVVYVLTLGLWQWWCKVAARSAAGRAEQLRQKYRDKMDALDQRHREELEEQQSEIRKWAEHEKQVLRERFEHQRSEIERQIDEVKQKREALDQLLST